MTKKFVRADSFRWSKLGKGRKKLQIWRRAKGIDSKIRKKKKGHPTFPQVGHKSPRSTSGKIDGKMPILVHNLTDLNKVTNHNIIIIGKIGAKKRIEVIKKAHEMKLTIANVGGAK